MEIKYQDPQSAEFMLQLTRSLVDEDLDRIVAERLSRRQHRVKEVHLPPADTNPDGVLNHYDNITNHQQQ